jgi:small subunit ribosomal protein S20
MAISLNKKKALKDKERQSAKRKHKTLIKNHFKEMEKCLKKSDVDLDHLKELFRKTQKTLDKAAQKGVIHKNRAADKKSKYSQRINSLEKQISLDNPTSFE